MPVGAGALDLKGAALIGFSAGGGEVARYIGRHGTKRVAKAPLISAVPPLMLKTAASPGGLPIKVFDGIRLGCIADRSQFYNDLASQSLAGHDRLVLAPGHAGRPQEHLKLHRKAFSETHFTEDLKKFDVPLILHGDDDQIVPIGAAALRSSKLVKNATLKIYAGAPHKNSSSFHLVVMELKPKEEIGMELPKLDQFFRVEEGKGEAVLNGVHSVISAGFAVRRRIIGTGRLPYPR